MTIRKKLEKMAEETTAIFEKFDKEVEESNATLERYISRGIDCKKLEKTKAILEKNLSRRTDYFKIRPDFLRDVEYFSGYDVPNRSIPCLSIDLIENDFIGNEAFKVVPEMNTAFRKKYVVGNWFTKHVFFGALNNRFVATQNLLEQLGYDIVDIPYGARYLRSIVG